MGYSHLSQGESLLQQNITAPADCPPETVRTSEAEGVDVFHLSVHHDHPAMLKVSLQPVLAFAEQKYRLRLPNALRQGDKQLKYVFTIM